MKAIITNDQGNASSLKLRLVAEGANDRTLMLLLELQHPMIHRQSTVANNPSLPEILEIPIASPQLLPLKTCSELWFCFKSDHHPRCIITSAPWEYAAMTGARLRIANPDYWKVETMVINGRTVPADQPCTVHPGGIVTLVVVHGETDGAVPEYFDGFLECPASTGPTEPAGSVGPSR